MSRIGRGAVVVGLVVVIVLGAVLATALDEQRDPAKALAVPGGWRGAWDAAHVLEGDDVALAWGDRAGPDPTRAPDGLRFDPEVVLAQLESLYALDVTLGLGATEGPLAQRKLLVVVDRTWSSGPGADDDTPAAAVEGGLSTTADARPPTRGAVVDGVPLLSVEPQVLVASLTTPLTPATSAGASPSAAAPTGTARPTAPGGQGTGQALPTVPEGTPWELARGVAEALQHLTAVAHPGHGLTPEAGAVLRRAASAYLATAAVGDVGADVADHVMAPHLAWGSPRHGAAGWLLLQQLAERATPGLVGDLWTGSEDTDHVLGAYARVTSSNASAINRRVAQYAMRVAADDVPGLGRSVLADLDPVLVAHRTTPVDTVPDHPGAYRVLGSFAPGAYGYNVVRLAPDGSGSDVRVRLRGHADAVQEGPPAGWSFGLVALGPDGPRYSLVNEGTDGELRMPLQPGEDVVYLVVAATPAEVVPVPTATFEQTPRYPYEFRVAGAAVDVAAPAVAGGSPHPNGGGWVDDAAQVDPAAYVAAGAVVRGDAVVGPGVRLEGRAWVEAGAQLTGDVVVRDVAVVRGAARLSGNVVVGGDAVVAFTCDAGVYTSYRVGAGCDGGGADSDVNDVVMPFAPEETALSDGVATVTPAPVPTPPPTEPATAQPGDDAPAPAVPDPSPPPAPAPAPPPPSAGVAAPPAAVPAGVCTARYEVTTSWPGGMQALVTVSATTSGVDGWVVSWTPPPGLELADVWGASFGRSGGTVTAENLEWNGAIEDGGSVTFGFNGTATSPEALTVPQLTCTRTR